MLRLRPALLSCLAAAATLGMFAPAAHADWPVARHDNARTGAATGTSNLRTPAPYWRFYLGGNVGRGQSLPVPVDDGPGVAYIAAGRLVVATASGITIWRSDNLVLTSLVGRADLDGDGAPELVAQSINRVFVFDATTGALR